MRWLGLLVPVLLLAATACGRSQGEPARSDALLPAPAITTPDVSPSESAGLDPCGLLSPAERSAAGLTTPGEPTSIGGASACDYTEPGSFGITITIDESSGLADLRVEQDAAEPARIGEHEALRVADPAADDGSCAVLLGIGAGASVHVDVVNADFTGTEAACSRAATVAELIEPDLPGVSDE
ncbi:DUF3558 family protein [Saccharomonospora sp. NPDC046836]|uniref:DUF3558 family protein n=1 Tax=Saccharomonospora sp. NPDC046836 TaxID=3156921 RepID=UPI0033F8F03C